MTKRETFEHREQFPDWRSVLDHVASGKTTFFKNPRDPEPRHVWCSVSGPRVWVETHDRGGASFADEGHLGWFWRGTTPTRDYSYVVYPEARVAGKGELVLSGDRGYREAKRVAYAGGKSWGGAVYDVSRGRFLGYWNPEGEWEAFGWEPEDD